MEICIDPRSGFCFGVKRAINLAEKAIEQTEVFSLGEVVHNHAEVDRLEKKGLLPIDNARFANLKDAGIFFRAHGEPPASFEKAAANGLRVIDGTCPIVSRLQKKIASVATDHPEFQIVICGKENHPEVIGLLGHSGNKARVASSVSALQDIDFHRPVWLFAQTTQDPQVFDEFQHFLRQRFIENQLDPGVNLHVTSSICGHVSGRVPALRQFAGENDVVLFVGGMNSSNARTLFEICRAVNPHTYFVENEKDLNVVWFESAAKTGITGATSTPQWMLEKIEKAIRQMVNSLS